MKLYTIIGGVNGAGEVKPYRLASVSARRPWKGDRR